MERLLGGVGGGAEEGRLLGLEVVGKFKGA